MFLPKHDLVARSSHLLTLAATCFAEVLSGLGGGAIGNELERYGEFHHFFDGIGDARSSYWKACGRENSSLTILWTLGGTEVIFLPWPIQSDILKGVS
ncbi:hypothetical protein B0H10DRAFT_2063705 [Mycena sp. CBHHK59/15]|nr:hypothetical protein B0H10DRAFT_2063705 [Mycena sp. CBHHK59/15]